MFCAALPKTPPAIYNAPEGHIAHAEIQPFFRHHFNLEHHRSSFLKAKQNKQIINNL